jgi:Tfp pilus assembly protein PilF
MAGENGVSAGARRLSSWKEIAAFVGRDERTVKRWEDSRGLPVRRVPGSGKSAVFAYAEEIESWIKSNNRAVPSSRTIPEMHPAPRWSPRLVMLLASFAAIFATVAVVAFTWRESSAVRPQHGPYAYVPNSAAAELYRLGLHAWQTRSPSGVERSVADFSEAIRRDPHYAAAYAGLAGAYDLEGEFTTLQPNRAYPAAAAAARRAIMLDPKLACAHAALAFADFYWSRDVEAAQREFRSSLALDPRSAMAHHWYATFLMTIGDSARAQTEIEKAEGLDSESAAIPADKGLILFHAGKTDQAVSLLRQLEEDQPDFSSPHRYLAAIWLAKGADASFLHELRLKALTLHDRQDLALAAAGSQGLARAGHAGMLRAILEAEIKLYAANELPAYTIADTYGTLGDREDAFKFIETSVARHEADNIALKIDPSFRAFHKDMRYSRLLADAGLASGDLPTPTTAP